MKYFIKKDIQLKMHTITWMYMNERVHHTLFCRLIWFQYILHFPFVIYVCSLVAERVFLGYIQVYLVRKWDFRV